VLVLFLILGYSFRCPKKKLAKGKKNSNKNKKERETRRNTKQYFSASLIENLVLSKNKGRTKHILWSVVTSKHSNMYQ